MLEIEQDHGGLGLCNNFIYCSLLLILSTLKFEYKIGAEVRGRDDGVLDSVSHSPAAMNGRIFRGVIFAPVSC